MKTIILALLICAPVLPAQNASAPSNNAAEQWKPLQFLVGTWEAKTLGGSAGAAATGTYTFQFELKNHILSRRTNSVDCKGPADFNCEHSDLLYIYPDAPGGPLRAVFFDNEGHVIHYDVTVPKAMSVVFISDSAQKGPQYRLGYELKGRELFGKFEIRMPGGKAFTTYLEWSGRSK
jgi:hypothetical protein